MSRGCYTGTVLRIILTLVLLIVMGNILALDYFLVQQYREVAGLKESISQKKVPETKLDEPKETKTPNTEENSVPNTCPGSCVSLIKESIPKAEKKTAETAKVLQKGEFVIPLGNGEVTEIGKWVDIDTAQAVVDSGNYPNIKTVNFEVIMRIPSGAGELKARLYDATTPYTYEGEHLKTTSTKGELLSAPVNLQTGKKSYKVQMYTSVAAGTLDSARIRIVTQ